VDRTGLRLADGQSVAFADVVQLCGQCHGLKLRDFSKGSHGGGRGYWDRTKGPWIRNSCVACHSAHETAYPVVMPAPPPNDRFLSVQRSEESSHHE
jgi:cytochrome c553